MSRPIPRPAPVTKATLDSDMPRILACAGVEGNHRAWPAILLTVGVGNGQVLEIPQSVDPNQVAAPESKSPAQASNDGQGDESAQAPDELGGLNDYQSQNAEVSGPYLIPVPVLVPVPVSPGFAGPRMGAPTQPAPGMGGVGPISPPFPPGGFRPTPPIILRPGGFAGIPSTSPMLTPPRGSAAIPGGWWTRTR